MKKKKSTLGWVMDFAGLDAKSYVLSVILAIVSVLAGFLPYYFVARVVAALVDGERDAQYYVVQCAYMAGCWIACKLFHTLSTGLSHKATFGVLAEIRRRLTKKLSLMPLGDVMEVSSGSYKNIIIERVDSVETTLAHMIPEVISNCIVPIGIFVIMLTIDWRLSLLSLLSIPLGMVFFGLMMVGADESFKNTINKTKALNAASVEYINGIEVIKAFSKSKSSYEKFKNAAKEGADCFIEWMRRCNLWQGLAMTLMPAQLLSLLPFSGWFYMKGWVSGTDAMMLVILSLGLVSPFMIVANYMDDASKMGSIIGEVTSILEKRELVRPEAMTERPMGNSIELKNVHFGYKDEEVLHGVNLSIKEGTVNALVGPSGSGKSTIAKLIASFWDVDGGEITYGGVDVKKIPLAEYNKRIAYVSQDNYLFDETVMENIRMGNPNATNEEVIAAAKACGCHDFIMHLEKGYDTIAGGAGGHLSGGERQRISIARAMLKNAPMEKVMEAAKKARCHEFIMSLPNGYDTVIGEGGASLSGGEKQRISIARAIMKDSPIIILDEATANVDPENEAELTKAIEELTKNKTIIMIAHRLKTVRHADQIFVISDGRIAQQGTHEELMAREGIYRNFVSERREAASWKIA